MSEAKIIIDGKEILATVGIRLSEVLPSHAHVSMPCGGKGNCGKCRVTVVGNVSAPSVVEQKFLTVEDLQNGVRLACLTRVLGDCMVTTRDAYEQQIRVDSVDLADTLAIPVFEKYGVAVDIGTTTMAACLYDREWDMLAEAGIPNPQAPWGADVVSRMENCLSGHGGELQKAVTEGIGQILTRLAEQAEIAMGDIDALVITGNTVMLHLLTGTSPEPLTHAPFEAKRLFGEWTTAGDMGLGVLDAQSKVYLMPCISAFVGGDMVAAMMANDFCYGNDTQILVDIGTNGEMALWHDQNLYVCSTAAGPAFEGAGISMGMSGGIGAVDHVTLCNGQLIAHVLGRGAAPVGICGSGIVDAVACLLNVELMDETGYLEDDPTPIAPPVFLTQADIRSVQLAKSAICAGLLTLMHTSHLTVDDVSRIYVAGGFGSYLDVSSAGRIGLLPQGLVSKVEVCGNAALIGASMVLLDRATVEVAEKLSKQAMVLDLATNPYFAECFMQGMMFE